MYFVVTSLFHPFSHFQHVFKTCFHYEIYESPGRSAAVAAGSREPQGVGNLCQNRQMGLPQLPFCKVEKVAVREKHWR